MQLWRAAVKFYLALADGLAQLWNRAAGRSGGRKGNVSRNRPAVAATLDALLDGSSSADEAVARVHALPQDDLPDELINDAYHYLLHFREDADIRERDEDYSDMQRRGLLEWSRRLRREQP